MSIIEKPQSTASIKFLTGSHMGSTFSLDKETITLGSDPGNDILMKDDSTIAPYHVRLLWKNAAWYLEKHPQAGTVYLNKQPVEQTKLTRDALIELGKDTACLFTLSPETPDAPPNNPPQRTNVALNLHIPDMNPIITQLASPSTLELPSLEITSNTSDEKSIHALDKPVMSLGHSTNNDIILKERYVSGQHLQIIQQGKQLILIHPHPARQNKGTLNGLIYQGHRIAGDEQFRKVLTEGDLFRIGTENGSFVTLIYHDGSGKSQEDLPPMQPIRLDSAEITIGRLPGNKVVLPHPQVSAHHALLRREGGTYRILDLNSTNHVYVNAKAVSHALLKMGDEIRIGPYRLIFESTELKEYDESRNIRIDALNLKRYGSTHVTLLNDISLSIEPRKFVAIVGGSGAGKSTLIKALSGLQPANEGQVLYNGQDYYRNLAAFKTQLGYVPQDDIVHKDLTVERALYYAAKLRLPDDFTEKQIQQRISEVLEDVELTGKQTLLIKSLSGGQRKRVSIALELLANPSLFFLDEPTSGLDPGLDRKMMFLLRKLADKGHTVILVTHATNNINTCDHVCFLTSGGRLAYFGPPDAAKSYFGKDDFAEIYSSVAPTEENPALPEEVERHFKASNDYQTYIARPLSNRPRVNIGASNGHAGGKEARHPRRRNGWKQFMLLCMRQLELLKNNVSNLSILLLQAPLIALVLMILVRYEIGGGIFDPNHIVPCTPQIITATGPLALPGVNTSQVDCQQVMHFLTTTTQGQQYARTKGGTNQALQDFILPGSSGDAQRVIFLVGFFAVLFGCINGTREIVKEAAIYHRERAVNLGILPYMLSKIGVLGLLAIIQSASILLIVQLFEPFSHSVFLPVLLEIYITLALVAIAGVMLGLAISAAAPNDDTANSLLPIIIIPQVIFAGSIIPLKDWFTQVVGAIFPTRWAMAALGSSLGLHSDKIDGGKLFGSDYVYHGTLFSIYTKTEAIQRVTISWAALGATIVVLAIIIGILLKQKDTKG